MGILRQIIMKTMSVIFIFGLLPILLYMLLLLWLTPSGKEKALQSWRNKNG